MPRKLPRPTFDQTMETLRTHGFAVSASGIAAGTQVSKAGVAAVLVPSRDEEGGPAAFAERPGILGRAEVAPLPERGYQKFFKTSPYEFPSTASQLHASARLS